MAYDNGCSVYCIYITSSLSDFEAKLFRNIQIFNDAEYKSRIGFYIFSISSEDVYCIDLKMD